MINSKKDYLYYLNADRIALGKPEYSFFHGVKEYLKIDLIWKFQRLLRKSEYYKNVKSKQSFIGKVSYIIIKRRFKSKSLELGFSIPENVFGPGLAILHYGTIIINDAVRIGKNCRIHACVNIGTSGGKEGAPIIGDNVYIGPGAKIYGEILIPNNCAIAANAAVEKTFFNEGMVLGGVPAKEIGKVDIKRIIKHI
ncbi:serine acetyltransferase [Aequorivita sp. H23M31]|uniref:Serine acetyltransferase n=1 Tax=Aequorivita ciconiae TaxID=2494375 RepID=A0A410G1Z8_9FLAO|nr:serine acetyltransferase [Aequorivita sp. H23M31]QAA81296.1 serine acetyltransferase [Aequorivita sp. H23M31]